VFDDLEGRVNILRGAEVSSASSDTYDWNVHPQQIRLAIDLVRFDESNANIAQRLLGKSVIVDTLADAYELHGAGPQGWRYVTRGGEVLEADGTLRAGRLTAAMGLLSRRSELDALSQQIFDVDRRIESLTEELNASSATSKAMEKEIIALRNDLYQSNTSRVE